MKITRSTVKIASRIASDVTASRLRGLDMEDAVPILLAIEEMALDAIMRNPELEGGMTSLLDSLRKAVNDTDKPVVQ